MNLPEFRSVQSLAFFLDFDGTLAEIAHHPDAVQVAGSTRATLAALHGAAGGALAIVTGREIRAVDLFLHPLKFPAAGVHGLERRAPDGMISSAQVNERHGAEMQEALSAAVSGSPGLLLESKHGALALHYRQNPELGPHCLALMDEIAARLGDVVVTRGKMVVEARFHRASKGTAVQDFMREPPFLGRIPVMAGDDVTDEDAFAAVNAAGGISIKVGPGETCARHRALSVAEFLAWLELTAATARSAGNHG